MKFLIRLLWGNQIGGGPLSFVDAIHHKCFLKGYCPYPWCPFIALGVGTFFPAHNSTYNCRLDLQLGWGLPLRKESLDNCLGSKGQQLRSW